MAKVKNKLPIHVKKAIYYSLSHSILNWGSLITGATSLSNINRLESVQNKIVRNLCNANYNAHSLPLYYSNNILKFNDLITYNQLMLAHKFRYGDLPVNFNKIMKFSFESGDRENRDNAYNFTVPSIGKSATKRFPLIEIIRSWNILPIFYKSEFDFKIFKAEVKNLLTDKYGGFICEKIKCFACGTLNINKNKK